MNIANKSIKEKISSMLQAYSGAYSNGYLFFGPATTEAASVLEGVEPEYPFITNAPAEWVDLYIKKKYIGIDPIIKFASRATSVFVWKELMFDPKQTTKGKEFWKDAREHGIECGITVPLHGPRNQTFFLSLGASECSLCKICISKNEIQVLAYQFYIEYITGKIDKMPDIHLTKREKDVLYWTAHGKSAWDISVILSISENTVNFHIKNIMKKLDVTNKVAASVVAVRLGLISI